MNKFEYAIPKKIDEVFTFLKEPGSQIKAGGIDLLDLMKEGLTQPQRLVHIRSIEDLHYITQDGRRGIVVGPTVTLGELSSSDKLQDAYKALSQAALGAATPQIRNVATLGGNLCQRPRCWYFRSADFDCSRKNGKTCYAFDGENQYHAIFGNDEGCVIVHPSATAVALMALDAKLKIASEKAEREIPISEFYVMPAKSMTSEHILKPGELITEIIIPPLTPGWTSYYYKQKEKQSFDWPIAEVAVVMHLNEGKCTDSRIVLGAAAPIPWRIQKTEALLKGNIVTKELAQRAAEAAMKDASPLSKNEYKVQVFKTVIARTICWAAGIDPLK
ncbi:xanthine dehydrogenase family protein subunit M [bacterium]|nr:xanthine dehydrogenase family protein subunit M [bacterium]